MALAAVHAIRPEPKIPSDSECVFLTSNDLRWARFKDRGIEKRGTNLDSVLGEFKKVATKAGVAVPGGFDVFRHVLRTVEDGARDQEAADAIMGHVDQTMAGRYVEDMDDERLQEIVSHVRTWFLEGRKVRSRRNTEKR